MAEPPEEEEGRATLTSLRSDIRSVGARQSADTAVLHGRFKAIEKKHDALASKVNDLAVECAKQSKSLDFLVETERKRAHADELELEQRAHVEKLDRERETAETVQIVKTNAEKKSFWFKVGITIVGLVGAAIGALLKKFGR